MTIQNWAVQVAGQHACVNTVQLTQVELHAHTCTGSPLTWSCSPLSPQLGCQAAKVGDHCSNSLPVPPFFEAPVRFSMVCLQICTVNYFVNSCSCVSTLSQLTISKNRKRGFHKFMNSFPEMAHQKIDR